MAPTIDILRHGVVRDRRAPADERLGNRAGVEGGDEDTSDSYAFAEPAVAKETRTCVYDRANLGRSGPVPGPRGLLELVGDLERLLKTAQIPGPYALVGTSGGGFITAGYAFAHPRQIAGLVSSTPVLPVTPPPPADALTSGLQRALLASSIFLLAAAVVALRVTNTRGEAHQPVTEALPEPADGSLQRSPEPALEDAA